MRNVLIALAVGVLTSACGGDDGHDDHVDATAGGNTADAAPADALRGNIETRSLEFRAGKFIEVQFATGEGDMSIIRLDGQGADVTWNVHGHADGETQTFDEGVAPTVDATFVAPSTDSFWFLIGNSSAETINIDIEIELFGDGVVEEWFL
jgi:hypothetical protein